MIKLKRDRKKVPRGLAGKGRVKKCHDLLKLKKQKGALASKDFKSTQWKPAKKQLKAESFNKCAYCEADTSVVAHGDVEHFRPKNIYWWLAYCYENYLYACQICNQTYKSNKFSIGGKQLAEPELDGLSEGELKALAEKLVPDPKNDSDELQEFHMLLLKEKAFLIDPYLVDPAKLLVWDVNEESKEVRVVLAKGVRPKKKIQKALDEDFGINREELCKLRYQDYRTLKTLRLVVQSVTDDDELVADVKEEIRAMIADDHRFAGMARYFVRQKWKLDVD